MQKTDEVENRKEYTMMVNIINEWMKRVEACEYVSFDLYDTLIVRAVCSPDKVFDLVEYRYNCLHKKKICFFRKIRNLSETCARLANRTEVNINDIYSHGPLSFLREKEELKELEKQAEIDIAVAREKVVSFLEYCRENGKIIIITTDMYLEQDTIEQILKKCNIRYDFLFISSEYQKTKYQGDLFTALLDELQITSQNIAHLGDNEVSDVQRAKQNGMNAILVPKIDSREQKASKDILEHILDRFSGIQQVGRIVPETVEYLIGFNVIGPFLTAFCRWIHQRRIESGCTRILFVSREGYLIKKIYEALFPDDLKYLLYFHMNKNLLRYPSLFISPTVETFLDSIPSMGSYSVREIFDLLPIRDNEEFRLKLCERYNITEEYIFHQSEMKGELISQLLNDILKQYQGLLEEQYNYLKIYMDENIGDSQCLLVNNSINGNGQFLLEQFLKKTGIQAKIIGIQFFKSDLCHKKLRDRSQGWLNQYINMKGVCSFFRYSLVLDHLLFEPSGTALKFYFNAPNIEVEKEIQGIEKKNNSFVNEVQKYALHFAENVGTIWREDISSVAIKRFFRLLREPSFEEAEKIGSIYDHDIRKDQRLIETCPKMNHRSAVFQFLIETRKNVLWRQGYLVAIKADRGFLSFYNFLENLIDKLKTQSNLMRGRIRF